MFTEHFYATVNVVLHLHLLVCFLVTKLTPRDSTLCQDYFEFSFLTSSLEVFPLVISSKLQVHSALNCFSLVLIYLLASLHLARIM